MLSFDGPSQPGMMHREGMVFRHDWEVPTGAVLDYLLGEREGIDADRIAMMGVSMGGYLAPLDYNLSGGIAEKITCPTLVLAGATDIFLKGQPEKVMEHLT